MPIFRRDNAAPPPAASAASNGGSDPSQRRRVTHIAPGTRLRGEVNGGTELLIEGELAGEVRVDAAVTVGAGGTVHGPIVAPVVRVSGSVVGNVTASDRVEVAPSGSVEGDISAPRIVIAEGAFFKGKVEMTGARRETAPGPPPPREP